MKVDAKKKVNFIRSHQLKPVILLFHIPTSILLHFFIFLHMSSLIRPSPWPAGPPTAICIQFFQMVLWCPEHRAHPDTGVQCGGWCFGLDVRRTSGWSRTRNPTVIRTPQPPGLWLISNMSDSVRGGEYNQYCASCSHDLLPSTIRSVYKARWHAQGCTNKVSTHKRTPIYMWQQHCIYFLLIPVMIKSVFHLNAWLLPYS